jgi:glycosyltransferase involved in cell wall biosynthesis
MSADWSRVDNGKAHRVRTPSSRTLSVVVPVHQGREHLDRVLTALADSTLPRNTWELIVVDDASSDGSAEIAAGYADLVVRLTGRPRGPAYARNRGVEVSRAKLIAFVDADVMVHPAALARMCEAMGDDPTIGAVVGAYDDSLSAGGLLSDYRNLLRHVEHGRYAGDTDAFAAGLAVVRRDAFIDAGMFDEWRFQRPQVEALELGDRLRSMGYRMLRRRDAQATHLKRWTFGYWIRVDLIDRGIAVARLTQFPALRTRADRLYLSSPLDTLLGITAGAATVIAAWKGAPVILFIVLACMLALLARNRRFFAALVRTRGIGFAAAAIPLHAVTCAVYGTAAAVGRTLYHVVGERQPGAVVQALSEVGMRTWPPVPAPRVPPRAARPPVQLTTTAADAPDVGRHGASMTGDHQ